METYEYKNKMVTTLAMPELGENKFMKITTSKNMNRAALETYASVYEREQCEGYAMERFAIFSDYHQRIMVKDCKRVTQKQVNDLHNGALNLVEDIKQNARDFYNEKTQ